MTTDTIIRVNNRINNLKGLSGAQLNAQWRRTLKTDAPDWPVDLLRRAIANRWQEGVIGGLSPDVQRRIDRLVSDLDAIANGKATVGTRYVRQWGGAAHHVVVVEDGYRYINKTYRSLTAIAVLITGSHRSGPHFFGLSR